MAQLTEQTVPAGSQQAIDRMVLEYHRRIAAHLLADPEAVMNKARSNLKRWLPVHEGTPSEQSLREWQLLLDHSTIAELISIITEDSDEGQRLRSSTPFTGILSAEERKELRLHYEERTSA